MPESIFDNVAGLQSTTLLKKTKAYVFLMNSKKFFEKQKRKLSVFMQMFSLKFYQTFEDLYFIISWFFLLNKNTSE